MKRLLLTATCVLCLQGTNLGAPLGDSAARGTQPEDTLESVVASKGGGTALWCPAPWKIALDMDKECKKPDNKGEPEFVGRIEILNEKKVFEGMYKIAVVAFSERKIHDNSKPFGQHVDYQKGYQQKFLRQSRLSDRAINKILNKAVSEGTGGVIDKMTPPYTYREGDVRVIASGMRITASWQCGQFSNPTEMEFTDSQEKKTKIPFMCQRFFCEYRQDKSGTLVKIPLCKSNQSEEELESKPKTVLHYWAFMPKDAREIVPFCKPGQPEQPKESNSMAKVTEKSSEAEGQEATADLDKPVAHASEANTEKTLLQEMWTPGGQGPINLYLPFIEDGIDCTVQHQEGGLNITQQSIFKQNLKGIEAVAATSVVRASGRGEQRTAVLRFNRPHTIAVTHEGLDEPILEGYFNGLPDKQSN